MFSMKFFQFSRTPTPLVQLRSKFFHPFDIGRPISNEPPFPNDNQSIKRNDNPWMTIICYQVFPSGRLSFLVPTHYSCMVFY